jgi:sugar lactone lactonase YvrE
MLLAQSLASGAAYRFYKGELRKLYPNISIPNAICFSPDRRFGYFADTVERKVWRVALDQTDGWPAGEPEVFLDYEGTDRKPDGAVFDADGNFVCAEWGSSRVSVYSPEGLLLRHVEIPARHTSCPAFGGLGNDTLYVTSARQGLPPHVLALEPQNGRTFEIRAGLAGLPEYQVVL